MSSLKKYQIILKNDKVHSFEFIMACLVKSCKHIHEQAEQCALIAHHKGECDIYSGDYFEVIEISTLLTNYGLNVETKELCM